MHEQYFHCTCMFCRAQQQQKKTIFTVVQHQRAVEDFLIFFFFSFQEIPFDNDDDIDEFLKDV